jgi:hypothetical protein
MDGRATHLFIAIAQVVIREATVSHDLKDMLWACARGAQVVQPSIIGPAEPRGSFFSMMAPADELVWSWHELH